MRTSALATSGVILTAGALVLGLSAAPATALDPAAPVVVNDAVEIYPYGLAIVDVLANDTDPGDPDGSDLALCRLPRIDLGGPEPELFASDTGIIAGDRPKLAVMTFRARLSGPATVDYYVCNLTHLAPATLAVTQRSVEPVTVRKVAGRPGKLKVTNHNDSEIVFNWGKPRSRRTDMKVVPGNASRIVTVRHTTITWAAAIGDETNMGLADRGRVTKIKLPKKQSKGHKSDTVRLSGVVRDLLERIG
jgi:hypothetical protein